MSGAGPDGPSGAAAGPGAAFADRVRRGEAVVGTFVKLAGLEPVDLAQRAGLDFVVADAEHSQLGPDAVAHLVRHAAAVGLPAMVRTPDVDAGLVNRYLEAGAAGIQVSSCVSAAQTRALVSAMRYPPAGTRSVSAAQPAAGYGARPLPEYLAAVAASPPLVVGQIETATTADPLDEVVGPLDVAFVGTTDLSVDMGLPGRMDDPAVLARVDDIARATAAGGGRLGGWAPDLDRAAHLRSRGATYLVVGSDLDALRRGLSGLAGPAAGS